MSDVAIAATDNQGQGTAPPAPPEGYQLWRRVRWAGYVLLGLQLVGYLVWSVIEYDRFSLTWDFALYSQAWYLIAHGNLLPFSTVFNGLYWHNDGEAIFYALAPLYWIWHSSMVLRVVQALGLAGGELIAFIWLSNLARRHCAERDAAWLAGFGLLLLLVNPWLWAGIAWDVHSEPMIIFFAVFLAWDLSQGKRRAWVWVVPVLLGGAATATYALGIGLGGVLAGRRTRRMGAAIVAVAVAYSLLLAALHGDGVAAGAVLHYLVQARADPSEIIRTFWDARANIIANLTPAGLVGIGMPLTLPLALAVVVPDTLAGPIFAAPMFQNLPLYVFLPVGTVAVLTWLLRRHRRTAFALAGVLAAQAIGWGAIWGPHLPGEWLRTSSSQAATLASVQARISASAEVVASQGIVGRFAQRTYVYAIFNPGDKIPLRPDTWFVITPTSGIETASPATSMALIGELAGPLHARLVTHADGVWAFHLAQPTSITTITVPGGGSPLPAWAGAGAVSRPVLTGGVSDWHMAATGAKGYVADGLEWQVKPGRYRAEVRLSASASASGVPVNVEVWDDNTNTLLARQSIPSTDGIQQIVMPVVAPTAPNAVAYSGWGPFRAFYFPPPPGQRIEVRVWSPGGVRANVYSADLTTSSGAPVPDQPSSP